MKDCVKARPVRDLAKTWRWCVCFWAGGCRAGPALERAAVTVLLPMASFWSAGEPGLSCGLRLWSARRLGSVSGPVPACLLPWDTLRQLWVEHGQAGRRPHGAADSPSKSRLPRSPQRGPRTARPPALLLEPAWAALAVSDAESVSAGPDLTERVCSLQPPSLPGSACSHTEDALSALSWRARRRTSQSSVVPACPLWKPLEPPSW